MSIAVQEPEEPDPSAKSPAGQGSEIPLGWKPTRAAPVPVVRCTQIKKDGIRCGRWSIRGYDKCIRHAGPQALMPEGNVNKYAEAVIEAGRLRLVGDTDKAIDVLNDLMGNQTSEGIRLKAATEILDRAGVRGGFEVKVDGEMKVSATEEITKRLAALREGQEAVDKLRAEVLDPHADVVDGEIIPTDDPDEQGTLF